MTARKLAWAECPGPDRSTGCGLGTIKPEGCVSAVDRTATLIYKVRSRIRRGALVPDRFAPRGAGAVGLTGEDAEVRLSVRLEGELGFFEN